MEWEARARAVYAKRLEMRSGRCAAGDVGGGDAQREMRAGDTLCGGVMVWRWVQKRKECVMREVEAVCRATHMPAPVR